MEIEGTWPKDDLRRAFTDKPILFSSPMVRAIQDGRKTQTRRVVKPPPREWFGKEWIEAKYKCPYPVGTRLWVRETFHHGTKDDIIYKADGDSGYLKWTPSIFMPRWASRINLEVTATRAERLQEISEEDAKAEGCLLYYDAPNRVDRRHPKYSENFHTFWDSINGKKYPWRANPWVWRYEFRRED